MSAAAPVLAQAPVGIPDPSLNGGTPLLTAMGTSTNYSAHATRILASAGKVIAAGRSEGPVGAWGWSVLRYLADGTLDTTFDGDGRVELFQSATPANGGAQDMAIDAQGRILVVGGLYIPISPSANAEEFAIVRLQANGSLDPTFGTGGVARVSFGNNRLDRAEAVQVQADGKVVVAGRSVAQNGLNLALARLTTSGQLDGSFGKNGKVELSVFNTWDQSRQLQPGCLAIDGQGRILVAAAASSGNERWSLARLTAAGKLDTQFGSRGIVVESLGQGFLMGLAVSATGQIVASGTYLAGSTAATAVVRYQANGSRDPGFGNGGMASTAGALPPVLAFRGSQCRVQGNGAVVVGGHVTDPGGVRWLAPFRFTAAGQPDSSFGSLGVGLGDPAPSTLTAFDGLAAALDENGSILVAGGERSLVPCLAWMRWL